MAEWVRRSSRPTGRPHSYAEAPVTNKDVSDIKEPETSLSDGNSPLSPQETAKSTRTRKAGVPTLGRKSTSSRSKADKARQQQQPQRQVEHDAVSESEDQADSDKDDLDAVLAPKRPAMRGKKKTGAQAAGKEGAATIINRFQGRKAGDSLVINDMDEAIHSLLFECVKRGVPVGKRMSDCVAAFNDGEGGGTALPDLFNFLLWSSGGGQNHADRTQDFPQTDTEEFRSLLDGAVEDLRKAGEKSYPLLEATRNKLFKGFRERFREAWFDLVAATQQGRGHHIDMLRAVIDLLQGLCECPLVSVRHTAACAGLSLGEALVRQTLGLAKKVDTAGRQLEAARSRGEDRKPKAIALNKDIEVYTSNIAALEMTLESIINSVFASRYRDVNESVRVDCLRGLGAFLITYPIMFLKDEFVKFFGWMLYDRVGSVRQTAVEVLLALYEKPENLGRLDNFTARFLKRMQELIHDVDSKVKAGAIAILRRLQKAGYLDEASQDMLDEIDEMLLDSMHDVEVRTQAMLFFTEHVDAFYDEEDMDGSTDQEAREEEARHSKQKRPGRGIGGGGAGQSRRSSSSKLGVKRDGVANRLVTVVQLLDYHFQDAPLEACQEMIATCVDSFQHHPEGDFLYDWPSYFDLLREYKRTNARLTDHEQSLLIHLLAASVKHAACKAEQSGKVSKTHKAGPAAIQQQAVYGDYLEALTSQVVEDLPNMLNQYQTDLPKMSGLVKLPRYLQRDILENKRNKGHYEALLKLLKEIFLKTHDPHVLDDVSEAFSHFQSDGDRLRNTETTIHALIKGLLKRLVNQGSCKSTTARRSSSTSPLSSSPDSDFSMSLILAQLGALAKKVHVWEHLDAPKTISEKVQQLVMERTDVYAWREEEESVHVTVSLIKGGMLLLYLLLIQQLKQLLTDVTEKYSAICKGRAGKNQSESGREDGREEEGGGLLTDGEGEKEFEKDFAVPIERLLSWRDAFLNVLTAVLSMSAQPAASPDSDGGSKPRKQPPSNTMQAVDKVKQLAYQYANDCRALFRPDFARYQVLNQIVWVPEPLLLRLMQTYFQDAKQRCEEMGDDEMADEKLVSELLLPLTRSVLFTTEQLNRRQAAAIVNHFVNSGKTTTEVCRFFSKCLKDINTRLYLEVQMSTLRIMYKNVTMDHSSDDPTDLTPFVTLAQRLAQTFAPGKMKGHQDSMLRFLSNGIAFAFENAPVHFTFLNGLHPFVSKISEAKGHELLGLFYDKTAELPDDVKEAISRERTVQEGHEGQKDGVEQQQQLLEQVSAETQAYLSFHNDLLPPGEKTAVSAFFNKKSSAPKKTKRKATASDATKAAKHGKRERRQTHQKRNSTKRHSERSRKTKTGPGLTMSPDEDSVHSSDPESAESSPQEATTRRPKRAVTSKQQSLADIDHSEVSSEEGEEGMQAQPPCAHTAGGCGRKSSASTSKRRSSTPILPSVREEQDEIEDGSEEEADTSQAYPARSQLPTASQQSDRWGPQSCLKRHRSMDGLYEERDDDEIFGDLGPARQTDKEPKGSKSKKARK